MIRKYPSMFDSYVGLTIDSTQFDFAQQRSSSLALTPGHAQTKHDDHPIIEEHGDSFPPDQSQLLQKKLESHVEELEGKKTKSIKLFCADASKPERWSAEIKQAIKPDLLRLMRGEEQSMEEVLAKVRKQVTWILALDTLYHFSPSRQPIFNHSFQNLHASIMAFDLILGHQATVFEQLCMCVLALLMGCPVRNFMTMDEYKTQLLQAGYEEEKIKITDMSEHVFAGLAEYIEKRDADMKSYFGRGIGAYKVFGRILRWWIESGVIKGCIVIAKI